MAKVILFAADGVAVKKTSEYFSERFAREYGAPNEELKEFFTNEYRQCQLGTLDLKIELEKKLPGWGWNKTVEEFLTYWFETDTLSSHEVLERVQQFRMQGLLCCLATDQEQYRAAYIREQLGFGEMFDRCFFSCELGMLKSNPEFFTKVLAELDVPASEVQFVDGTMENVEAAQSVGIDARFYNDISDLD